MDIRSSARQHKRPEEEALLMVSQCSALQPQDRVRLLTQTPDAATLTGLTHLDVERRIGRPLRSQWNPRRLARGVSRLRWWLQGGSDRHLLWVGDQAYPEHLALVYDPPAILFGRGDLGALNYPRVGVVGTRRPDQTGLSAAAELGASLAASGVAVVSGLARGIDGAAHRGVIGAQTGHGEYGECDVSVTGAAAGAEADVAAGAAPAIAVLGCGIDRIYPVEHKELAGEIVARGGLLLSEYPPGTPPARYQFPARNRIVVGLSQVLVVVQAPSPSGALISAEFALAEGRDVLVHTVGRSWSGCRQLLDDGARLIETVGEVLQERILAEPADEARTAELLRRAQEAKLSLFAGLSTKQEEHR